MWVVAGNKNIVIKNTVSSSFDSCWLTALGHHFFLFLAIPIFSQQLRVGGRNKNKIHSDHFPIELKSKETGNRVSFDFNSIGK